LLWGERPQDHGITSGKEPNILYNVTHQQNIRKSNNNTSSNNRLSQVKPDSRRQWSI